MNLPSAFLTRMQEMLRNTKHFCRAMNPVIISRCGSIRAKRTGRNLQKNRRFI